MPFLLKDLRASYRGVRTSGGSAFMAGVPDFDSEVTLRYKRAGLLIMGKTNVPEMGLSIDTQNAMFGPPATHGTSALRRRLQRRLGGGRRRRASSRRRMRPTAPGPPGCPASNCGLFGLKTSRGRITYGPDVGEELIGASTQHACTLSVRDSAALLDLAGAPDYGDPYWAPPGPGLVSGGVARPRRARCASR